MKVMIKSKRVRNYPPLFSFEWLEVIGEMDDGWTLRCKNSFGHVCDIDMADVDFAPINK